MNLCEITGEAEALCQDITAADFFEPGDFPPLSHHRTLAEHIEMLFDHYQSPSLPRVFD